MSASPPMVTTVMMVPPSVMTSPAMMPVPSVVPAVAMMPSPMNFSRHTFRRNLCGRGRAWVCKRESLSALGGGCDGEQSCDRS